jgi:hypothetical protein
MKKKIDLRKVKTYSIKERKSKVFVSAFGHPGKKGISFHKFSASLPDILAGRNLRRLVKGVLKAKKAKKPVIMAMGGHVVKSGASPFIIELMKRKIVTGIAMNGATSIHDFEIAFFGRTSEDVAASIKNGRFGFVEETGSLMNEAVTEGARKNLGMGEALGKKIAESKAPYKNSSLLYQAASLKLKATVHVSIGSDIIHQHPMARGEDIGETSYTDFIYLTEQVSNLGKGGVFLNVGSAVVLPEVFLKALSISRNLGNNVKDFITGNFDIITHYRPQQNILSRPVQDGGESFSFVGHHEIMLPLFTQMLLEGK